MALDNASYNTSCPQWYLDATRTMNTITYQYIAGCYFVLGISMHAITLKAFRVEAKKEKGYTYQIFLTGSRISLATFIPLNLFSSLLAFSDTPRTILFRSSYWCMWMAVKVITLGPPIAHTAVFLFSILVGFDRLYALWKPMLYNATVPTKRKTILTVFVVASISAFVAFAHFPSFDVVLANSTSDTVLYARVPNLVFSSSLLGRGWQSASTGVLATGLIALYVCNIGVVVLYRKRRLKANKILNKSNDIKKREAIEKLLTLLACSQSICFTIAFTYASIAFFFSSDPSYYMCGGRSLHTPIVFAVSMLSDLFDFVFIFVVNKRFRGMILKTIGCHSDSSVEPTPVDNSAMRQNGKP